VRISEIDFWNTLWNTERSLLQPCALKPRSYENLTKHLTIGYE